MSDLEQNFAGFGGGLINPIVPTNSTITTAKTKAATSNENVLPCSSSFTSKKV